MALGQLRVRRAAVAGQYYPADEAALRYQLERCFRHHEGPTKLPSRETAPMKGVVGAIMPHAGYKYSGPTAARVMHAIAPLGVPEVIVLLGPNHHGAGPVLALPEAWAWETPLGQVRIHQTLAEELAPMLAGKGLEWSDAAHQREHSLEVIVPFCQYLYGNGIFLLPVAMEDQSLETSTALGAALAQLLAQRSALIIASSDLSHYVPESLAHLRDGRALEAAASLDVQRLWRVVNEGGVNMCGPGPVMAMMTACRTLGVTMAKVLGYSVGATAFGAEPLVVGYGAMVVTKDALPKG